MFGLTFGVFRLFSKKENSKHHTGQWFRSFWYKFSFDFGTKSFDTFADANDSIDQLYYQNKSTRDTNYTKWWPSGAANRIKAVAKTCYLLVIYCDLPILHKIVLPNSRISHNIFRLFVLLSFVCTNETTIVEIIFSSVTRARAQITSEIYQRLFIDAHAYYLIKSSTFSNSLRIFYRKNQILSSEMFQCSSSQTSGVIKLITWSIWDV